MTRLYELRRAKRIMVMLHAGMTYEEIGKQFGISKQRVKQIEKQYITLIAKMEALEK